MSTAVAKTTDLTREEWLTIRSRGIGGSDIAAIAGIHPWKSAHEVWAEKVGMAEEQPDNERMRFGRLLEDLIAQEYSNRTGQKVRRVNAVLYHPEQPLFLGNIDREIVGDPRGRGVLEIKTTSEHRRNDWADGIPYWVEAQLQWYLGITGWSWGVACALIGGNRLVWYEAKRDDEVISQLQSIALEFWNKYVVPRVPPPVDGTEASGGFLASLYPESNGQAMDLPPTALALIRQREEAKADEEAAKRRRLEAENKLKELLGEYEVGWYDRYKVIWKTVKTERIDTKRLRAEQPEIAAIYIKESMSRRFEIQEVS